MHSVIDYPASFRQILLRRIDQLSVKVHNSETSLTAGLKEQTLHILDYGLSWSPAWPATRQLLLAMAPKMEQAGHRDDWLNYLNAGLTVCDEREDWATKSIISHHLGYMHQIRGRYPQAILALQTSAALCARWGDADGQAKALNRLAYIARLQGRHEDAISLASEALALLDDDAFGRQFSYFVLGTVKLDLEGWPATVHYLSESLLICQTHGKDPRLTALRHGNLGVAYWYWGRYLQARQHLTIAIELFTQLEDVSHIAVMEMNLGNVLLDQGNPREALTLYDRAAKTLHALYDEYHITQLYLNYGRAYRQLSEWSLSERYLKQSVERRLHSEQGRSLANARYELGLTYLAAQEQDKALHEFRVALKGWFIFPVELGLHFFASALCMTAVNHAPSA